ncbi:MAG: hypothetical protein ACM33U_13080 [Solirubrobacterales bacterium]
MEHRERREHLERLLDDIRSQREVDLDEVLMEMIHLVLELEEEVARLRQIVARHDAES